MMRGRSLAFRLALLLAGILVVVLAVAGVAVNRAASRSVDEVLAPRDQERLNLAAAVIDGALERDVPDRAITQLLRRIANDTGGVVRVTDADGSTVAEAGRVPAGTETQTLTTDLAGGGTLEIEVRSPTTAFLRAFNATLLAVGAIAVIAMLGAAVLFAGRVTRPLREVAVAARRLGAGDLAVRAQGGADAESAELATAFNEMATRLERSETLRRRAASDLAHDLATPATVLESQLQAMVDGVVPADATELERARAAAAALSGVVGQLGELMQAESAPLARREERIGLAALASETVAALEGLCRERGVTADILGEDATVFADRGQLARALRNVLTNAVQHSSPGARVVFRTSADGTIRVTDAGPGIGPDDVPFVFERFYRADRSRSGHAGTGIGLTVARELVVANGGSIEVESTGSDGTTFRIGLPLA